jgi:PAS domain S-box-containing protein
MQNNLLETYYQSIFNNSDFRIIVFEHCLPDQFKVIDCNTNSVQNSANKKTSIIGKTLNQLLGESITSRSLIHLTNHLEKCFKSKKTVHSDERVFINRVLFIKKNQFIPILNNQNEVHQVLSISYLTNNLENSKNKLVESRAKFDGILKITFAAVIIHQNGIALNVNESFLKMFGYDRQEVIGKNIIEEIVQEDQKFLVLPRVKNHTNTPYEVNVIKKDGESFVVKFEGSHYEDDHKNRIGITVIRDITKQKNTFLSLVKTKNEFSKFQQFAQIGGWTLNLRTVKVKQSREHQLLFKHFSQKEDLTFQEFILDAVHPEDYEKFKLRLALTLQNASNPSFFDQMEFRVLNSKQKVRWLKVTYFYKSQTELQGFTQDITHQKNKLQKIIQQKEYSEENGQNAIKALKFAHVGHFEFKFLNKDLFCSPELLQLFGISPEKTNTQFIDLFRRVAPADKFKVIQSIRKVTTTRDKSEIALSINTGQNQVKKIIVSCQVNFKKAWPETIFGIIQEITSETTSETTIKKMDPNRGFSIYHSSKQSTSESA